MTTTSLAYVASIVLNDHMLPAISNTQEVLKQYPSDTLAKCRTSLASQGPTRENPSVSMPSRCSNSFK
eukprot:4173882-Pyramimonas_sp.AAC.1